MQTERALLKGILKRIVSLGLPLLAGNLSHYIMHVVDAAMVGQLGTDLLAAIAIGSMFSGILFVLVWPVSAGTQAYVSRRYGRQETADNRNDSAYFESLRKTGEVLDHSLLVALLAGILAWAAALFAKAFLRLILDDPLLIGNAFSYISIIKWDLPVLGLYMAIYGFLGAINRTRLLMIATVGSNGLNIFFNYVLIFGKLGFPALGIRGAALGTILAQFMGFLFLFLFILKPELIRKYRYLKFRGLERTLLKGIIITSLPIAVQNGMALTIMLLFESMIARVGTVYLAVTHVVFSVFRINKTIVGGFAQGAAILVGNSLGTGRKEEAAGFIYGCELIAGAIGILILLSMIFFPEAVVRLFSNETITIQTGVGALRFFAAFFFIEVLGYSFEIVFTQNGWGKFVLFSEFLTNVLFILGLTYLLTQILHFGVYASWLSFALYQVFHALIMTIGFFSRRWQEVEID